MTEEKELYEVKEVATQTQPVLHNTKTEKNLDIYAAIAIILNKLEKIDKSI